MNKKKCPQCKNLILISAPTCLFCGRPNKFVTKDYINKKWNNKNNNKRFFKIPNSKYLLFIFVMVVVILIVVSY